MAHNPSKDKKTSQLAQKLAPSLGDKIVIIDYAVPSAPVNKIVPYSSLIEPNIALMTALAVALG